MSVEKKNPFVHTNTESSFYENGKFVGGYVSKEDAEYLRLLALYHATSVNGILNKVITYWEQEQEPEDSILEVLADRAHMEWIRRTKELVRGDLNKKWEEYKMEIRERLKYKHLSDTTIDSVIEKMEELQEKS